MRDALRRHWPEYLIEGALLGIFMISAASFTALLEHPASPVRQALSDGTLRRTLIGLAMGATAILLIYSPWGKRSGAHFNPAVTLAFLRLRKVPAWDAAFYVAAHFLGGLLGMGIAALLLKEKISDPSVEWVVTQPGVAGPITALGAELAISFLLMTTVLAVSSTPAIARSTGLFAGALVALFIVLEAPLSGMSMNPARTFASALPAGSFRALWIYFVAPPLGMFAAVEARRALGSAGVAFCARLSPHGRSLCLFCGRNGSRSPASNSSKRPGGR
jgi:aquaporin Z